MHVTVLDGSTGPDGPGERLMRILVAVLGEAATTKVFALDSTAISSCSGCFGCWNRNPGQCWKEDAGRQLAEQAIRSDLLVFFSPVTFGGYSAPLKNAVDRLIPLISPYHLRVAGTQNPEEPQNKALPHLLAIGWQDHPDSEAAGLFRRLAKRNGETFHTLAAAEVVGSTLDEGELQQRIGGMLQMMEVIS